MVRGKRLMYRLSIIFVLISLSVPVGASATVIRQDTRDFEVELETQPTDTYEAGDTLTATFRAFEFQDRATDDVSITITPPAGVTDLSAACAPESSGESVCPSGDLGTSFVIPAIAGQSGVLLTVTFTAPDDATGDLELAIEVAPPSGAEEAIPFDNRTTVIWSSGQTPVSGGTPVSGQTLVERDLEVEWETQPETTYTGQGETLTATFQVFEYQDRATDDVSVTITPPSGVNDISVSCTAEAAESGSTCPTGELGTSFVIPAIAGQSGVLLTVAFTAPDATTDLELAIEVAPPSGAEETIPLDNRTTAIWSYTGASGAALFIVETSDSGAIPAGAQLCLDGPDEATSQTCLPIGDGVTAAPGGTALVFTGLADGTYRYAYSSDVTGYQAETGDITIAPDVPPAIVTIVLQPVQDLDVAGATPAASPVASPATLTDSVEVIAVDIAFDQEEMTIPADTDVQVTFVNNGNLEHDWVVEDTEFAADVIGGGEETTITVNLPAGEYVYFCSVIGHRQAGMEGTLTVE